MRKTAGSALLLIASAVAAYFPALFCGFIWDDDLWLTERKLDSLSDLAPFWFSPGHFPQYYPLVHTTFFLEEKLWGLSPMGFHAVNILLHAACAVFIWRILQRLRVPGALLCGFFFSLHPICVESVAWVTERKNVLAGVFFFSSILCWLVFFDNSGGKPRRRLLWYFAAFGLFCCAVLAKTVTVTLPAAVLLLLYFQNGRIRAKDFCLLVPLFIVSALSSALTVHMERALVGAQGTDWAMPFAGRVMIAGRALWFYFEKILIPHGFTFIYPRFSINPDDPAGFAWPLAAVVVLLALLAYRNRIGRGPFTAAAYFAVVLSPALGFFNVFPFLYSYVADHFAYLAAVSLMAMAAAGIATLVNASHGTRKRLLQAATGMVLLLLGMETFFLCFSYKDQKTLWTLTLEKNPGAWIANNNLGAECLKNGDLACAESHFLSVAEKKPDYALAYSNLGGVRMRQGRKEEAKKLFENAVAINPDLAEAHFNLANIQAASGMPKEARAHLMAALRVRPDMAQAAAQLAANMEASGNLLGAMGLYLRAVETQPDPEPMVRLGVLYAGQGDIKRAKEFLLRALAKDPENARASFSLGALLLKERNYAAAAARLSVAAFREPENARAAEYLGLAFLGMGRFRLAEANLSRAASLDPGNASILSALARAKIGLENKASR